MPKSRPLLQAAWERIEALGGSGVWESDMVVVSFKGTAVTDDDLAVFADFPLVEILDLRRTAVTDRCLAHLEHLTALGSLDVTGTKITPSAIADFQLRHPSVKVTTKAAPKGRINPFTGKPMDDN